MSVFRMVRHFAVSVLIPVLLTIFFATLLARICSSLNIDKNSERIIAGNIHRFSAVDSAFSGDAGRSINDSVGIQPGWLQRAMLLVPESLPELLKEFSSVFIMTPVLFTSIILRFFSYTFGLRTSYVHFEEKNVIPRRLGYHDSLRYLICSLIQSSRAPISTYSNHLVDLHSRQPTRNCVFHQQG